MPLVKCEHCNARIRPTQLALHLKRCVQYRKKLKHGLIKPDKADKLRAGTSETKPPVVPNGKGKNGKGKNKRTKKAKV